MPNKSSASDKLLAQLSKTMPTGEKEQVSPPAKKKPSEARKTSSQAQKTSTAKTAKKPSKAPQRVQNRNTSLYPEDDKTIFEIQTIIRQELGKKCSDSRAIQLALKICPLKDTQKILSAFDEVTARDGRGSKNRKS